MSEETAQTGTAAEAGRTGTVDVQQVLQMLLEDRRQREVETERRLQEMQQHVESLMRVVEKTTSGWVWGQEAPTRARPRCPS